MDYIILSNYSVPRQARINVPGAVFHVITRGLDGQTLFRDDADRREFLSRLSYGLKETGNLCYAWSLMPNHIHLMVRCGDSPLSDLMRPLLTGYAVHFNHRHKRTGYLYQNRYKSVLCQEDIYFLELVRYIHLNPLRANLVNSMEELVQYPWTGHRAIIGEEKVNWQATEEVLGRFSNERNIAINNYTDFLNSGLRSPALNLAGGGLRRSPGGWRGEQGLNRDKDRWRGDARILGDADFVNRVLEAAEEKLTAKESLRREGWDMKKVITRACDEANIHPKDIHNRGRANGVAKAKGLAAFWATHMLGLSGEEVGRSLGLTRQAVLVNARKGKKTAEELSLKLLC